MKNFRDLHVWHKAHELTLNSYVATWKFPREELYGLTSQIRRSAASIGANLAEGCGKRGNADFARYVGIAAGSASELEYHFLLARDLNFLDDSEYRKLTEQTIEIKRMLAALLRKIDSDRVAG